jgi:hypothetical protein
MGHRVALRVKTTMRATHLAAEWGVPDRSALLAKPRP